MRITRRFVSVAAAVAALAFPLLAVPAQAANSYVALGDSYSSGVGTRSYISDGTSCQRSVYAYPSLLAAAKGLTLNFRACSGASVADVTTTQLGALTTATTHVTITVGGNDAGFAPVLTECAKPAWMSSCMAAIDRAQYIVKSVLPGRLSTLYASIKSKAPNAKVVVVGCPRIFNGVDCNALTWFSSYEMYRLNQTADLLNGTTSAQAAAKGLTFANPTTRFVGHAVCDSAEWINGLSSPVSESYHPKVVGQRDGYAVVVATPLTGSAFTVTSTTLQQAALAGEAQAATQKQYAALDATVTPEEVRAPDLRSPAAAAAAARAGVDLSSRASIDAADRVWSQRQAVQHARR